MNIMDDSNRLQLQKMIQANNVEDQTKLIRDLKHSIVLKSEINTLLFLKSKYADDPEKINLEAMTECNFLFTYYTDIYNKIRKDEIDLKILFQFLDVLKRIEEKELDQHEGSFLVGTLLKEMYIDSALKKAEKLDKLHGEKQETQLVEPVKISWKQYKHIHL
jgi:hypothetical protein